MFWRDKKSKPPKTDPAVQEALDRDYACLVDKQHAAVWKQQPGSCEFCRHFWLTWERWRGTCKRFPKEEEKRTHDCCGEFEALVKGDEVTHG